MWHRLPPVLACFRRTLQHRQECLCHTRKVAHGIKFHGRNAALLILAGAAIIFFWRPIVSLIGKVIDLSMFLVAVSVLPLVVLALGWFIYSVWGKAYFRAWHINHLRNARLLKEASRRGEHTE